MTATLDILKMTKPQLADFLIAHGTVYPTRPGLLKWSKDDLVSSALDLCRNSDEGEGGPPFLELKKAGTSIVVQRQYGEDTRVFLTVELDGEKFLIPLERA